MAVMFGGIELWWRVIEGRQFWFSGECCSKMGRVDVSRK